MTTNNAIIQNTFVKTKGNCSMSHVRVQCTHKVWWVGGQGHPAYLMSHCSREMVICIVFFGWNCNINVFWKESKYLNVNSTGIYHDTIQCFLVQYTVKHNNPKLSWKEGWNLHHITELKQLSIQWSPGPYHCMKINISS